MNSFFIALVYLVTSWSAIPVTSWVFLANEFLDDHAFIGEAFDIENRCTSEFEPYYTNFIYENTSHLLWVSNASASDDLYVKRVGDVEWFGNDTRLTFVGELSAADFTVYYEASVGVVNGHTYNSTECLITARNTGYTMTVAMEFARNYTGSTYLYIYPASNVAILTHVTEVKNSGNWSISISCPGADSWFVNEVVDVVQKEGLVRQRDVFRHIARSCAFTALQNFDLAQYIIE